MFKEAVYITQLLLVLIVSKVFGFSALRSFFLPHFNGMLKDGAYIRTCLVSNQKNCIDPKRLYYIANLKEFQANYLPECSV